MAAVQADNSVPRGRRDLNTQISHCFSGAERGTRAAPGEGEGGTRLPQTLQSRGRCGLQKGRREGLPCAALHCAALRGQQTAGPQFSLQCWSASPGTREPYSPQSWPAFTSDKSEPCVLGLENVSIKLRRRVEEPGRKERGKDGGMGRRVKNTQRARPRGMETHREKRCLYLSSGPPSFQSAHSAQIFGAQGRR